MLFGDGVLMADGAMATNLFARGLPLGEPPEAWLLSRPDVVTALHEAFIAAGADIILTNSFGGHPLRLRAGGLEACGDVVNRTAARLARIAADRAGRRILVAGAVGPTGYREMPAGAAEGFRRQMEALAKGGSDLIWIETMSYPEEIRRAAGAAAEVGVPYALTASFGPDRSSLGGLTAAEFATLAIALPVPPVLLGVNCGSGIDALLDDLAIMQAVAPGMPLVAKASAGLPAMVDGGLVYPLGPPAMAAYAWKARMMGVRVIGGCCGVTPAYVTAMHGALSLAHAAGAT